ncbi:hypothetical protein Slin14017_G058170 [Septoria linicola]|nr:hypothetical protein Slin14017_G058170 [Septoria linicola]
MQRAAKGDHGSPALRHDPVRSIAVRFGFLERSPIFDNEEAYAFRYQADVPVPLTNMEMTFRDVTVCDIRGQECHASLDSCGFEIRKLRSEMSYEQYRRPDCIKNIYVRDLKKQLCEDFGASDVDIARVRVGH